MASRGHNSANLQSKSPLRSSTAVATDLPGPLPKRLAYRPHKTELHLIPVQPLLSRPIMEIAECRSRTSSQIWDQRRHQKNKENALLCLTFYFFQQFKSRKGFASTHSTAKRLVLIYTTDYLSADRSDIHLVRVSQEEGEGTP